MIIRIGKYKLFRWRDGKRTLQLTLPGYVRSAPKLPKWEVFFVGRHTDRTVWTYRRTVS